MDLSLLRGFLVSSRCPATVEFVGLTLSSSHEFFMTRQEEVGQLDFAWVKEFGPTWIIKSHMGVRLLSSDYYQRLTTDFFVSAERRPDDGRSEGMLDNLKFLSNTAIQHPRRLCSTYSTSLVTATPSGVI